jgi:HlyD family secretion protein
MDTSDLELSLQEEQANVAAAQAKYDGVAAGASQKDIDVAQANVAAAEAKYRAAATISPKDLETARANLDRAIAAYNSIVQGTTTPQDIANAEASLRSAQAKLDALKAGANKSDIQSAQSKVQQAQENLAKVKAESANNKEQARIKWEQSADATRDAQRKFDIANATYQQAKSTNKDPNGAPTPGQPVPTITPLKLDGYKQAADSALLAEQQAEKTQEANRLAYEQAKKDEVTGVNTAQQQLNDAQAALSKLLQGPTPEDVTQAQAAVDQAQAQLDKLKRGPNDSDLAKAQADIDAARATLKDLQAGPKEPDLTQAQTNINSAMATLKDLQSGPKRSDLETALAALDQAKATRDAAQIKLNQATLKAPFAGVVSAVGVVEGQMLDTSTKAFTVTDDSQLHIDTNLSEADSTSVAIGQIATISLDALPDARVTGTVRGVAPTAATSSNVTSVAVRVVLDKAAVPIRPGATANVTVTTKRHDNVLVVPAAAIQSKGNQQTVTVSASGVTFSAPVQTGLTDGLVTEITGGLQEGDTVVIPRISAPSGSSGQSEAGQTIYIGAPGGGPSGGGGGPVIKTGP